MDEWRDRLQHSDINKLTIKHIVDIENEALLSMEMNIDKALENVLKEWDRKNYLHFDDVAKGIETHYDLALSDFMQPLKLYYRGLVDSSRDDAYLDIGIVREARRKMIRKKAAIEHGDKAYEEAVDRAFTGVRSVGKSVVEELKDSWIEQGGPNDVVRNFLLSQEEALRDKPLSRIELKERLRQLWMEKRYVIQRIIRTETVNTHSLIQLQEWFDQGIIEVERVEMNDLKTCTKCRALSYPGNNIYLIEDLLQGRIVSSNGKITSAQYPVSCNSHPQCRGSFRPRPNLSVFEDFTKHVNDFVNAQDIEVGDSKANNVPIEYQAQVEKALNDFGPDYGIKFVPEIVDSNEWKEDRLNFLQHIYSDRDAQIHLEMEQKENRGRLVQYVTQHGNVLVSGNAGDINRVVIPILREKANQAYLLLDDMDKNWVENRYATKIKETTYTLEEEGVEIIGQTPFISPLAEGSPKDYFIESYTSYVGDPIRLMYMDKPMYEFLRKRCMTTEYIQRGGIN